MVNLDRKRMIGKIAEHEHFIGGHSEADRRHQRTGDSGRKIIIEGPEDEKPIHLVAILSMASSYL